MGWFSNLQLSTSQCSLVSSYRQMSSKILLSETEAMSLKVRNINCFFF